MLFAELRSIFPAWKWAFPDDQSQNQAKRTWAKAFIENRIHSIQQVQRGLSKARASGSPHIPSVGQFIKWCQPEPSDFGLPDEREAYFEALRNATEFEQKEWSHPAVFVASRETTTHVLRAKAEKDSYAMFQRNYQIACRRVFSGEDLSKEIPLALPEKATYMPVAKDVGLKNFRRAKWEINQSKLRRLREGVRP